MTSISLRAERQIPDRTETASRVLAFAERLIPSLQQRWQGTLFSMERGSMKLTEAGDLHLMLAARIRTSIEDIPPEQVPAILRNSATVLFAFLQTKDLIANIDQRGLIDLVVMSIESCKDPQYFHDMEIRIGYGAANLPTPNARAASYVVPAKIILTSLRCGRERQELVAIADGAALGELAAPYQKIRGKLIDNLPLTKEQETLVTALAEHVRDFPIDDESASRVAFPQALPRIIVYSAHHFVGQTNNGEAEQMHANAAQNAALVRRYIEESCDPRIAERFSLDADVEVNPASMLARQIEYFTHCLRTTIDPKGQENREKILRMGQKHARDNEEGSLQYAAAHALYSSDDVQVPPVSILQHTPTHPSKLIMIGGEPEKTFWRVRQTVAREASIPKGIEYFRSRLAELGVANSDGYCEILTMYERAREVNDQDHNVLRAQLICKIGELPVYAGGYDNDPSIGQIANELSLSDLVALRTARTSMKEDLFHIIADLAGVSSTEAMSLLKAKQPNPALLGKMEQGYQRFRRICASVQAE